MRRVKSDPSLASHGLSHVPGTHATHSVAVQPNKTLSRKSISCSAIQDLQENIIAETIIQAPISVAAPCLETYGFPSDILHSKQATDDFLACILNPPDPIEKTSVIPHDEARDEQIRATYDRLMRAYVMRRKKRNSGNSVESTT